MRPKFFSEIELRGGKALAVGPLDLSEGDIEVAVWARVIQYQLPDGTPKDKEDVCKDPHVEVSGWAVNGMDRKAVDNELAAAVARLAHVPTLVQRANPGASPLQTGLKDLTMRNNEGPRWPVVEVTAQTDLLRNEAEGLSAPREFRPGPAHAEAWIWVERQDDDGGTYQFSLYWNDDMELVEQLARSE
jgi:hypothetical protein